MGEQHNTGTIEGIYAAFGRGDLPSLLNALAADVDWYIPGPAAIPWSGARKGRDAVAAFFGELMAAADIEQFSPNRFVGCDDHVVVFGNERARMKSSGRSCDLDWVHAWRLKDGVVVEFREYTDTAAVIEALAAR